VFEDADEEDRVTEGEAQAELLQQFEAKLVYARCLPIAWFRLLASNVPSVHVAEDAFLVRQALLALTSIPRVC